MLISDSPTLAAFCKSLADAPYIACDTEFVRERTYYAQLALIQVAYGDKAAAIDPLAPGIDLSPLKALMLDERIVKVFHAGTEDLELLLQNFEALPNPIYDTQVANALCGTDAQIGYARLVQNRLGIELDKASQRTNWARRPLSERQLAYALADVTHLCTLYEGLKEDLKRRNRSAWAEEEMRALSGPSRYQTDPEEAWKRIRVRRPTRRTLVVLKALAAWREQKARSRNLPRPWVLKNDALVQIAQALPTTKAELLKLATLKHLGGRWRDSERILSVVQRAITSPQESWPELPPEKQKEGMEELLKRLRKTLNERCEQAQIAPSLVATRRDLEELITRPDTDISALKGWRFEFFGEQALAIIAKERN